MNRSNVRVTLTAVPLVICNLVAFTGQLSFIRDHMSWPLIGDLGFAAGIESIAIFLAFMAHDALMAEDSAFKLRMGSYGAALIAAGLNWSHYSAHGHPTFAAVGTAVMSAASPFLWGIFSRRQSRDALMAKGLIEPHAARLGSARWLWHPVKSLRVQSAASWLGIQSPAEAIALIEPQANAARTVADYQPETLADMRTQADAVRFALAEIARAANRSIDAVTGSEVAAWLHGNAGTAPGLTVPTASYCADVIRRTVAARDKAAGSNVTRLTQTPLTA